jgi:hypothetical protein
MDALAKIEIEAETQDARSTLAVVRGLPIATVADRDLLNDLLVQVRDSTKSLEARRAVILDPLKASLAAVKAFFSPPLDALGDLEVAIRGKVSEAALAARNADNAARDAAKRAALAGDTAAVQAALAKVQARPEGLAGLAVTYSWEAEILDFDQIPREWLAVDWSKVKIYCKDHAKREAIPAVQGLAFKRAASTRAKS